MSFASFIGNQRPLAHLRTKLRESRFPHALILAGPDGVGKHTFALMLAKALNCTNGGPDDFCDECAHCRKIDAGTHPDVLNVTMEDEATQIKVEQVRQVLSVLQLHPLEGRNKVFIIDPANALNAQASNALLKGLEEPPENSFFILVTVNLHEMLLTIRSRCQVYHFSPLTLDEIRRQGVTDELAVRWSQGSIGRARSLDLSAIKAQRDAVMAFLDAAVTAYDEHLREMFAASADVARTRQDLTSFIPVAAVVLSDLIHVAEGTPEMIVNIDIRQRLEALAARAPADRWLRVSDFLLVIETGMKSNLNRAMLADGMALTAGDL